MYKKFLFLLSCLHLWTSLAFSFQFHQSEETLYKIMELISRKEKGAYLRFGDGDVILATGESDSFQQHHPALQEEMREAFQLNGPSILKCLPLGCKEFNGWEEGMFDGNHEQSHAWCLDLIKRATPLWGAPLDHLYSPTALSHCSISHVDLSIAFLKFLKAAPCALFVGNCNIPPSIRELLFGPQCQFVSTPSSNSYTEINRIERECLKKLESVQGYKVIVTAMGCSGRILQKRLWNQLDHLFLFDFGSLMDALCGWNTRAWIHLTHFDHSLFLKKLGSSSRPRIVYTSALLPRFYEERKEEYIASFKKLAEYGYDPYVIEACCPAPPSFLERYSSHVFYANVNNYSLKNKGVQEAMSLLAGFNHYAFDDQEMIVKITGRYLFENDSFLKMVENHPEIDAFVKCDPNHPPYSRIFTGCFALRYKLFKELLDHVDLKKMEEEMVDIETEMAHFIQKLQARGEKIMYMEQLGMRANLGNLIMTQW